MGHSIGLAALSLDHVWAADELGKAATRACRLRINTYQFSGRAAAAATYGKSLVVRSLQRWMQLPPSVMTMSKCSSSASCAQY